MSKVRFLFSRFFIQQSTRIERLEPISISKIAPVIGSLVQELATPEVDDVTDIFQLAEKQFLKCGAKQLMETSNEEDDELAQTDKTDDVQIESTAKGEEQKKPR